MKQKKRKEVNMGFVEKVNGCQRMIIETNESKKKSHQRNCYDIYKFNGTKTEAPSFFFFKNNLRLAADNFSYHKLTIEINLGPHQL